MTASASASAAAKTAAAGVGVAHLDCKAAADTLDAIHDVDTLVNADDVGVCCCHALQQSTTAADVQDDGQLGVGLLHTVNHLGGQSSGERGCRCRLCVCTCGCGIDGEQIKG